MSKELEALKRIKSHYNDRVCIDILEDFDLIETALKDYERRLELAKEYQDINNVAKRLKALETIKNKKTNVAMLFWYFKYKPNYEKYVEAFNELSSDYNEEMLTKEEYELLKEVLL